MGARSPEGNDSGGHGDPTASNCSNQVGGKPKGVHKSRDGDGCLGELDGGDDDDDDDGGEVGQLDVVKSLSITAVDSPKKRKKPKKKKPKKKTAGQQPPLQQSSPPRIPLSDLFPSGDYPRGEIQKYKSSEENVARTLDAEIRSNFRQKHWSDESFLPNYRKAAEIHRQTRRWVQETAKPGLTTLEIVTGVEDSVRALLGNAGLEPGDSIKSGMGFPTGICLNHQVAHYTPNPGQKDVVLQPKDVMTVDFGVHINGWIVDSAFTMGFDHTYDNLLAAVRAATNAGIKTAGVDVRISDVSAAIQETMESYEVEVGGRTFPVKAIRNLTGHNIGHYHIHGGKSIPFVKNNDQTKMEEGEAFAIETFGSTGSGRVSDDVGVYGYGLNHDSPLNLPTATPSAKRLHKTIRQNFGTIVFCRRYLDRLGIEKYLAGMNCLVSNGIVEQYKPLADIKGSYSAQFEHTFLLHDTHKEVLSRGDDY